MSKATVGIIVVFIICIVGSLSTNILHHYGMEYGHIACIYIVAIWANIIADKIELDMDK